jgi:lipopolysaccharide/colanic/teichoic acid biosynthesis glycosyltransferase
VDNGPCRGPAFEAAERIGIDGRTIAMLKLRSTVVDAESQPEKRFAANEGDGVLFKAPRSALRPKRVYRGVAISLL